MIFKSLPVTMENGLTSRAVRSPPPTSEIRPHHGNPGVKAAAINPKGMSTVADMTTHRIMTRRYFMASI